MTFQNLNSNTQAGGGGGFLKFSQGAVLTPSAGSISPTDTHHHVAAGAISAIATTFLDTNEQQFLVLTADGTVTFTAGASLVVNTLSLASGQSIFLALDGGTVWREIDPPGAAGGSGATQTANRVFAGPTSGGAAVPAFRALVDADIPHTLIGDLTLSTGDLVVATSTKGIKSFGRSFQDGVSQAVAFSAGNFTATGSMTWTVASGDMTTNHYAEVGKRMFWSVSLVGTTVGGTLSTGLKIAIPNSRVPANSKNVLFLYNDNGGGLTVGLLGIFSGVSTISLLKLSVANWSAATDATDIYLDINFGFQ